MAIFAIGDMHLSLGTDKPMDVFPGWEGYLPRLEASWRKLIGPDDTVVLAGDTSWAMNLNDTKADFAFIQNLPGQKWLLKGNHDMTGGRRPATMENFLTANGFDTLHILHNNACSMWAMWRCAAPAAGRLTTLQPRAKSSWRGRRAVCACPCRRRGMRQEKNRFSPLPAHLPRRTGAGAGGCAE